MTDSQEVRDELAAGDIEEELSLTNGDQVVETELTTVVFEKIVDAACQDADDDTMSTSSDANESQGGVNHLDQDGTELDADENGNASRERNKKLLDEDAETEDGEILSNVPEEEEDDVEETEKMVGQLVWATLMEKMKDQFEKEMVLVDDAELLEESFAEEATERAEEASGDEARPMTFQLRRTAPEEFTLDLELDENALLEGRSMLSEGSERISDAVSFGKRLSGVQNESVDREYYLEVYRCLEAERASLQRLNQVLQQRLLEHYKRRRMANMFVKVEEASPELELRYKNRLAEFAETSRTHTKELEDGSEDLQILDDELATLQYAFHDELDAFIEVERQAGVGLVAAASGRVLNDHVVEALLGRQRDCIVALSKQRECFVKLGDKLVCLEAEIRSLEDLGDSIKMAEYEQLRIEYQNRGDKAEERDEEMARLRQRTGHFITALAHLREKSCALVGAIDQQFEALDKKNVVLETARRVLRKEKTERDKLREHLHKETQGAGLLMKPQLLRDYATTNTLRDEMRAQVSEMSAHCATELRTLKRLREQVEKSAVDTQAMRPQPCPTFKQSVMGRIQRKEDVRVEADLKARLAKDVDQQEAVFQIAWNTRKASRTDLDR